MASRERSVDEADELSSDVGFDVFVIWRVEPYNISSSLAFCIGGTCGSQRKKSKRNEQNRSNVHNRHITLESAKTLVGCVKVVDGKYHH